MKATYDVIVGNIGTVYSGRSLVRAKETARTYIEQSKSERGWAGGESVTIFHGDNIISEYVGSVDQRSAE